MLLRSEIKKQHRNPVYHYIALSFLNVLECIPIPKKVFDMHKYHVTLSRGRSCLFRNWLKYLRMQKRNNFTLSAVVYALACSEEGSIGYLEQFIQAEQN